MELFSTLHQSPNVRLEEAVFRGLPPDNGLYVPVSIPKLPDDFFSRIDKLSFQEIAFEVSKALIGSEIPANVLREIVYEAINFDAPLVQLEENIYVQELFHGPSLAFKDFGARFMARLMSYFLSKKNREVNILVATSGDTGGAVALGFLKTPGINVTILYPSGKVSNLQEKQLTTLDNNITALEINGTFDDCQRLVKQAFLDDELSKRLNLSSANSINIARLIPQSFYYFYAYSKVKKYNKPLVSSVPSGNFGNLTAGLIAYKMGLPVKHFVASTNANDVVPEYLETGIFKARPSVHTLSNAMDVGNPSNYPRMTSLFDNDITKLREMLTGYRFTDKETTEAIEKVYKDINYIMCPHTAVAYLGLKKHIGDNSMITGVFLSTAHPAKFIDVLDRKIADKITLPESLQNMLNKKKKSVELGKDFEGLKNYLLSGKN